MGYIRAAEMIGYAGEETALRDHLRHNLFPPVRPNEVNLALARCAINVLADELDSDEMELSDDRGSVMLVRVDAEGVVRTWHLEAFVDARCSDE